MIELTDTQRAVIEEASNTKYDDVRELKALKKFAPAIRENVIKGMLKRELLTAKEADGKTICFVSDKGYAAIGNEAAEEKPGAPKTSKQDMMLDLLSRKKGVTIAQLQEATGWQKHSVHGAMANMKKKLKIKISSEKGKSGERVYRLA